MQKCSKSRASWRVPAFRMNSDSIPAFAFESLEQRTLMTGEPWGSTPQLIGLDAEVAANPTISGAGQTIAIIDTGIDYTRPELGGGLGSGFKVVGGHDFVDDDEDPLDTSGHGTRVAAIAAADDFLVNGRRYRGVAPDADLVALRIDAGSDPVPDERLEEALQWIISHRDDYDITVVNISFGFGDFSAIEVSDVFGDELAQLKSDGVFIVSSSGNGGVTDPAGINYPAADPNVFSVGSVDDFGTIASYTARGTLLDVLAPGDGVHTIDAGTFVNPEDAYVTASGTSFAAPTVAGAAALILQASPTIKPDDVASILRASSIDVIDGDDEFGATTSLLYPLLQVDNAVALALSRKPGQSDSIDGDAAFANNNSMSYDRDGVLHLAYYDSIARTMKYATRTADGTGWSAASVVDGSDRYLGQYVSLSHNQFGRPAIAYFDGTAGDLKYAEFNGASWDIETLDFKGSTGLYPTLLFDNDDRPVISYYQKADGNLRLARRSGGSWTIYTIDSARDVGRSTSMALNADGKLGIAYEDTSTGHLRFAQEQGDGSFRKVDADSTTTGVAWISLGFSGGHTPIVSYYDATPANLKVATLDGSNWKNETLVARGATGLYGNLVFDKSGTTNILYYNRKGNQLTRAYGSFGAWDYTTVEALGGKYATAASSDDGEITYSWLESEGKVLHIETL